MKESRKALRIPFGCRLFFCGDNFFEGEGRVIDLSKSGCAVECETAVEAGMALRAIIFLPDYEWQLTIEQAAVRWVRGHTFGLEFLSIRPIQRERLRVLIAKFKVARSGR